jgi:hypothetical protein
VTEKSEHGHAAVLNDHVTAAASGTPTVSVMLRSRRATNVEPPGSGVVGVSVAVLVVALYETEAGTIPPGPTRVKDVLVMLAGAIARENVAVTLVERAVYEEPSTGVTERTEGAGTVLNVQLVVDPSGVPSAALTEPAIVAVYVVDGARCADGVSVAVRVLEV